MKLFKYITLTLVLFLGAAVPILSVAPAYAIDEPSRTAACEGIGAAGTDCNEAQGSAGVAKLVATAVNILSWVVGVAAVIMIIVGGLKYVVSGGDSNGISSAKNTILYALVGLAIAVIAQGLVRFVLARAA